MRPSLVLHPLPGARLQWMNFHFCILVGKRSSKAVKICQLLNWVLSLLLSSTRLREEIGCSHWLPQDEYTKIEVYSDVRAHSERRLTAFQPPTRISRPDFNRITQSLSVTMFRQLGKHVLLSSRSNWVSQLPKVYDPPLFFLFYPLTHIRSLHSYDTKKAGLSDHHSQDVIKTHYSEPLAS
ncbi:hypothetical protein N431DRAFT_37366 [Stipitochalara longipes BDJ]|nr:hypothetical protein N431DRAFT_37366 [Stipitochalara longipes BDJ]